MKGQQQGKSGGAKIGRNRIPCERYRAQGRRERNKLRKLRKHVRGYPGDLAAKRCLVAMAV